MNTLAKIAKQLLDKGETKLAQEILALDEQASLPFDEDKLEEKFEDAVLHLQAAVRSLNAILKEWPTAPDLPAIRGELNTTLNQMYRFEQSWKMRKLKH